MVGRKAKLGETIHVDRVRQYQTGAYQGESWLNG